MGMGFVEQQANAWAEIREWAQEAESHPLIPTQPGGSWDGPGSSLSCTGPLRERLGEMLQELGIKTMLDVGCGDWNWMRLVDLGDIAYTGWDVDPERILRCQRRVAMGDVTGNPHTWFEVNNILTEERVMKCDLILCRDVLAHLPNHLIIEVLDKFKRSGSHWLLASTYPGSNNEFTYDPTQYAWVGYMEHPVNMQAEPFRLHKVSSIPEDPGPGGVLVNDHELGLFEIGWV